MQFGDLYTTDKGMKVLYSGLAGGVAGLLGFAGYFFTRTVPVSIRVVALIVLAIAAALPTILLSDASASKANQVANYSTCPVCGYVAYDSKEQACNNCGEELTEEEMHRSEVSSIDSLIRLDQAFYFIPDSEGAPITFKQPAISEDGYTLDNSWKPSISKAAVEVQAIAYYKFKKRNPVKVSVKK